MIAYRDILAGRDLGRFDLGSEELHVGDRAERIARIRQALKDLGFHAVHSFEPDLFGHDLRSAVFRFQAAYGLSADGVVGEGTLEALADPKDFLLGKLREALGQPDRPADDEMVVVNIAAQRLYYAVDGEKRFSARVVAGRPDRETPELTAKITGITFNPSWYIPPGIEDMDILPQMALDSGYAEHADLEIYDVARDWARIGPADVDWSRRPTRYTFVQRAGPKRRSDASGSTCGTISMCSCTTPQRRDILAGAPAA